jgi:hypothetical protein
MHLDAVNTVYGRQRALDSKTKPQNWAVPPPDGDVPSQARPPRDRRHSRRPLIPRRCLAQYERPEALACGPSGGGDR